ncbi:MAG: HPr family phosphocarrier protein [Lachnospiraceae bacterium]|jgi:phosphotransferase system HPr (HPr) family protein
MIQKEITVKVEGGIEARQTAVFVQTACGYESQIYLQYNDKRVNAKSIMGMLSLGITRGSLVTLFVEGSDEEEAARVLEEYLSGKAE